MGLLPCTGYGGHIDASPAPLRAYGLDQGSNQGGCLKEEAWDSRVASSSPIGVRRALQAENTARSPVWPLVAEVEELGAPALSSNHPPWPTLRAFALGILILHGACLLPL